MVGDLEGLFIEGKGGSVLACCLLFFCFCEPASQQGLLVHILLDPCFLFCALVPDGKGHFSVYVRVCVCVWVCVWERPRRTGEERGRRKKCFCFV